eukprot:CAMPEP_0119036702 /NCGR_PEP_ID=MMETSP1177-20130426/4606_1 /TAXON_ID=2985 /ORGANISM="Ochromonas sp, Strain CCMP1899" /LENGTH=297 /DNA_ID=CAMNT_0006996963 /DNA_START=623 /DNA_END=1516 /DNA_ORIENTATION=-
MNQECGNQKVQKRFLKSGFHYFVELKFGLANSPKNIQLGKFMVHTTLINTAGAVVAVSSRPVVIPYISYITLMIDAVVKYPLRALGLLRMADVSDVYLDVMNDFKEPIILENRENSPIITTEFLKLQLSTSEVDIDDVLITVMPVLKGLTWFLYYYPYICWSMGVVFLTCVQLGIVISVILMRFTTLELLKEEDEEEEDEDSVVTDDTRKMKNNFKNMNEIKKIRKIIENESKEADLTADDFIPPLRAHRKSPTRIFSPQDSRSVDDGYTPQREQAITYEPEQVLTRRRPPWPSSVV